MSAEEIQRKGRGKMNKRKRKGIEKAEEMHRKYRVNEEAEKGQRKTKRTETVGAEKNIEEMRRKHIGKADER
jgi:hypothetical protein